MPSSRSPSAGAGSTGPRAAGGGKCGCGARRGQILHRVWQAHTDIVMALAFSPDERTLASGSPGWQRQAVGRRGWNRCSGRVGRATASTCLAFAPDGRLLASGGRDATVRLWDPQLGTLLEEVPHPGPVFALAWSPDGRLLASGDFAGTIRLWEIGSRAGQPTCVQTLEGHSNWVRGLAFAPDGSRLASASWDGTRQAVGAGRADAVCQTLEGHTGRVQPVAWSPDGGTLASGGWDHTIRLWDGQEGTLRAVLQGHSGMVYGLAFTPDSRSLLSGSDGWHPAAVGGREWAVRARPAGLRGLPLRPRLESGWHTARQCRLRVRGEPLGGGAGGRRA